MDYDGWQVIVDQSITANKIQVFTIADIRQDVLDRLIDAISRVQAEWPESAPDYLAITRDIARLS